MCLPLATLPRLVQCLWVRPGAYPRVEPLKGVSLGWASTLPTNTIQSYKDLQGTNTLANYSCKKLYNIGPWALLHRISILGQNIFIEKVSLSELQ